MRKFLLFLFTLYPVMCNSQVPPPGVSFVIRSGIVNREIKRNIESNTSSLLKSINESFKNNSQNPAFDSKIISQKGGKAVSGLWRFGHFYCSENSISATLLSKGNSYQVRDIPVIFGKNKIDMVIEYSPGGIIDTLYLELTVHDTSVTFEGLTDKDKPRGDSIIKFIEVIRTYYYEKKISSIEKLYSDDALIIVGRVLEPVNGSKDQEIPTTFTSGQVQYMVRTKKEYLEKLLKAFNNTTNLIVNFKSIVVKKHPKNANFYGVQLQQTWESTGYADDGYLFLLFQFKKNGQHLIWVRTWQDIRDTQKKDAFGLPNFKIPDEGKISN
jgi:hypothetical protein